MSPTRDKTVAVLGAGSWGTALALVLCQNGRQVNLWGHRAEHMSQLKAVGENQRYLPGVPFPPTLSLCEDLATACQDVKSILMVVPSSAFRETLHHLKPHLAPDTKIHWATKGLDPAGGRFLHEVISEICGQAHVGAVLSGPSFAREVAAGLPTAVCIAATEEKDALALQADFHNPYFRVYLSQDIVGLQLGGALKNVLAIATGISDGLGFGANARSALITRGLAELSRLGQVMGGSLETFMGLAGVGDLILTCTDDQSRNRRFGLALGAGLTVQEAEASIQQVVEGVKNAGEICQLAQRHAIELPICEQVQAVVSGHCTPQQAVKNLLSRELPSIA